MSWLHTPEEVLAIIDHADDEATKEEEAEAEAQQVAAVEANQDISMINNC
jgi:PTS system fructose-specific IIC component